MSTGTVPILIAHASVDGHTQAIAERIGRHLELRGLPVRVRPLADLDELDVGIRGFVAGACVRYGRHDPRLRALVARNANLLGRIPWALFSVDLTARDPARRTPERNAYVRRLLASLPVRPDRVEILAGRLDYPAMRPVDRWLVRLIMQWTGGPTDPTTVVDYTDWRQVERLAHRLAGLFDANEFPAPALDGTAQNIPTRQSR